MRFGSLFSGIEAASAAWLPLGWKCAWTAEIDPFASAVLEHHYPDTPNVGDITKVDWNAVEPVDLVVGGPPCQDFSVAGQRAGHTGTRGNLSLAYVDAIDAIDPVWSLAENVPGWLSMGDNSFGRFLGRLVGADAALVPGDKQRWTDSGVVAGPKRTAAWRILDAQYFGVPQRRRRVFVLTVRGAGNWACAEALFPVAQGVQRHPPARREAGEGIAHDAVVGALQSGGTPNGHGTSGINRQAVNAGHVVTTLAIRGRGDSHDLEWRDDGTANAILTPNGGRGGIGVGAIAFDTTQITSPGNVSAPQPGDPCHPLASTAHPPAVLFDPTARQPEWSINRPLKTDGPLAVAQTLRSNYRNNSDPVTEASMHVLNGMSVRRLTPRECLKLQGFPPDYLDIQYRGKPAADGNKYRATGNSMAVPVIRWIGQRIQLFEDMQIEALDAAD